MKGQKIDSTNKENTDNNAQIEGEKSNKHLENQSEDKSISLKTPEKDKTTDNIQNDSSLVISPEQKLKMDESRLKAVAKLLEKQTCGLVKDVGTSWLNALEPEFKKTYFQSVNTISNCIFFINISMQKILY